MVKKFGFRFWLNVLLLAVLGLSPVASVFSAQQIGGLRPAASVFAPQQVAASPVEQAIQAAGLQAPRSGPAAEVGEVVAGPQMRQGMDDAPPPENAVVTDQRISAWETRFNTQAGVEFMDALGPPSGLSPQGANVDVGGWRSYDFGGTIGIAGIASAPDGRVFVGTRDAGLKVFSHNPDGSNGWSTITASPGGLATNFIRDVAVSGAWLWVAGDNAGISQLDLNTGVWTNINTSNSNLPSNYVSRIHAVPAAPGFEEFFTATQNGAWIYVNSPFGAFSRAEFVGQPVNYVYTHIHGDGTRTEWYATDLELWSYDGNWTLYPGVPACDLDSANVMAADGAGGMWFGVYLNNPARTNDPQAIDARFPNGVCRFFNGTWTRYTNESLGLPSNFATDLQSDSDGRVWMAFQDYNSALGGAAVYDQGTWLIFKKQYGDPLLADQLNFVSPVGESVWFGYTGRQAVTQYSNNWVDFSAGQTGGSGAVSSIFLDTAETYIGRASGISYHNGAAWIYRPISGLTSPISRMARLNNLWVATRGNGIYEYDGTSFIPHTTAEGLPSDDVRDLLVDSQFRLWAATAGGLALRTNGYWLNFSSANSPLLTNDLTALTAANDGRIYIATNGGGVTILNPQAEAGALGAPAGEPAWMQQTSADGLPGDVITGLAAEPGGGVWAIGPGGASRRDPDSGIWTMITTLNSTAIATDPSGRVWLGTTDGLWQYNKVTWTVYRTAMTLLDSNRILGLASDGLRTWVASGGNVQARADFNGPIGFIPPYINSFVPVAGGASDPVSLYGGGYDIRRTSNNTVSFGNLSDPMTYAAVTYVDAGQINVEVPLLARSGQIWVRANRLNGASAGSFTVIPKIRSVSPTCAAMGGELTIEGSGFNSTNEASYIKIGNGPWRFADAQTPTGLRYRLRPGDGDGTVSVRVGVGGTPVTSTQSVTIDTPVIDQVGIQQGIQGLPLVWAKRTLIMLSMRSQRGLCSSRVDGGKLEFKLKDGSTREDWLSFQPTAAGLTIGPVAPPLGVSTSINFVMWSQALSRPDFSINDFDGVRLHLFSGPVEVVTYDVPNNSFFFTDLDGRRQHMNVYIYDTSIASNASWDAFYKNAEKGLDHVARAYPQSDLGAYYGRDKWMTWAWRTIGRTGLVDLSGDDTFHRLQGQVEDIRSSANDNGGNYDQAMGVIEASLKTGNTSGKATYDCSNPFGDCDMHSAVAFNTTDNLAHTWMQEAIHTMGWIADSSPNHDGGNKTHSRYNNFVGSTCTPAITFRQALVDQLGYAARVVRLEYGKTPYQFLFTDCTAAQMPNSVMSYAPGSQDNNSFLEPLDYFYVFNNIRIFGRTVATGSGIETGTDEIVPGVIDTLGNLFGLTASPQTHQELRLNGEISGDEPHTVTITMSYLDNPGGNLTEPTAGGQYILNFRDASGANLLDFPFSVGAGHTHGAPEKDFRFGLRVPFPDATARVAISHDGAELWSSPVSAGAPLVSLTSPVQYQSYNAVDPLPVTWNASDPDGDPLNFILEYSPDDGATWQTIATGLSGSGYDWIPAFSPIGTSRLRITATDGFNTAQATSEQFFIQPDKPIAIIQSPADGQVISEGGEIALVGGVVASESSDPVQFDWYYDGNYAGSGQYLYDYLTDIGAHTIGLQVIANGLPSEMATIAFTVVKDADWDGLPNDYEQSYGINPLDRSDSAADPDGDGLSSLVEFQIGTSPVSADSDGDTMNDGDELEQGGNPSDAGSLPPTAATLNVGAQRMGFIYRQGDPNPDPWTIWITNAGTGALNWTASTPAGWLNVSPSAGSAPTALTLSADPSGLAPGVYSTFLTVSAPGAVLSPRSIPIWIRVYDANGETSYNTYLPVLKK